MVKVFSLPNCPQCDATKRFLRERGVEFVDVDVSTDSDALEYVKSIGFIAAPVVEADNGDMWSGFRPELLKRLVG